MVPYDHKVQYYEPTAWASSTTRTTSAGFEEARVDLLEQLGFGYDRIEEPVTAVRCWRSPASTKPCQIRRTVRIEASITQYNGVRMTLHYNVYDKATGTLRCTGDSRHCFINAEGKPAYPQTLLAGV